MLLAVSVFGVGASPQEAEPVYLSHKATTYRIQFWGHIRCQERGDLKHSGLKQLFLAVICSHKSTFSRIQQDSL